MTLVAKLEKLNRDIESYDGFRIAGTLRFAEEGFVSRLPASIGDQCEIIGPAGHPIAAEVIRFVKGQANILPYERAEDIRVGMQVIRNRRRRSVPVGEAVLGRIIDGLGRPVDGKGPIIGAKVQEVANESPPAIERERVVHQFRTGQSAIDGLLTCGRGQRVGIFSGSGVGKSTMLGQLAQASEADVNVVTFVGERGCELRPFVEDCLGTEGLKKSVVVISTCEQQALMRKRSVETAISIAEYFRNRGGNVLFLLDSLTRLAMAQRELGISVGEPPSSRGYTPSVFQLMAETIERLGNSARGSITGFVSVLVDGDDLEEPISDAARALLDGHIVLDRRLAERNHYPAIDIARSVSRSFRDITDTSQQNIARKIRAILSTYSEMEDLIRIGTYQRGSHAQIDRAIELMPEVEAFLRQEMNQFCSLADTLLAMERITSRWLE